MIGKVAFKILLRTSVNKISEEMITNKGIEGTNIVDLWTNYSFSGVSQFYRQIFPALNIRVDSHKTLRSIRDEGGWGGGGLGFQQGTACRDSGV